MPTPSVERLQQSSPVDTDDTTPTTVGRLLTPEEVRAIRAAQGSVAEIGRRFNRCRGTISDIRLGKAYAWVGDQDEIEEKAVIPIL